MGAGNIHFDRQSGHTKLTYATAGTFNFIVPVGVTKLDILAWGGGASGKDGSGAGGLAGNYESWQAQVTPGETVSITVGAGGIGGPGNTANPGGDTIITTTFKTYTLLGGAALNTYSGQGEQSNIFALDGQLVGAGPGGQAGWENGGDGVSTGTKAGNGGSGAGGGSSQVLSTGGGEGGNGGDGIVFIWYKNR